MFRRWHNHKTKHPAHRLVAFEVLNLLLLFRLAVKVQRASVFCDTSVGLVAVAGIRPVSSQLQGGLSNHCVTLPPMLSTPACCQKEFGDLARWLDYENLLKPTWGEQVMGFIQRQWFSKCWGSYKSQLVQCSAALEKGMENEPRQNGNSAWLSGLCKFSCELCKIILFEWDFTSLHCTNVHLSRTFDFCPVNRGESFPLELRSFSQYCLFSFFKKKYIFWAFLCFHQQQHSLEFLVLVVISISWIQLSTHHIWCVDLKEWLWLNLGDCVNGSAWRSTSCM